MTTAVSTHDATEPVHHTSDTADAARPTLSLAGKICAIMGELDAIAKTGRNSGQGNYQFIEHSIVEAVIRPVLARWGVAIFPAITAARTITDAGTKNRIVEVDMEFVLVNADDPSDSMTLPWVGEAADTSDKCISKAGTSGEKYFLLKLFHLSDKEDPDQDTPEVNDARRSASGQGASRSASPAFVQRAGAAAGQIETVRGQVKMMMTEDKEAASKLPKTVDDMTTDELQRTLEWLRNRAKRNAAT